MATKDLAERLRAIRERAEKATPGPWSRVSFATYGGSCPQHGGVATDIRGCFKCNAAFIENAREDVVWLINRLSEVESGSEGVTDEDAIERGAAALFKHAELSSQDDGSFAYAALGEIGKERYRKAVRSVVEAAIGSRLASAAKAEARVSELERIFAELRVEAESWEKRDNVFYDRVTEILDESEFSDARALLHASSERAEEGGK